MITYKRRFLYVCCAAGLSALLSSCSTNSAAVAGHAESAAIWSTANQLYAAGEYSKAIQNLDRLVDRSDPYQGRALPLSLVLTSGVAAGYIDVAECFAAGARSNKSRAGAFRAKTATYRALANHMVLQFAENARRTDQLAERNMEFTFAPPRGNGAEPPLFAKIANGILPDPADEETTVALAIERGVIMSVTSAVGAGTNIPKAEALLHRGVVLVPRATFMNSIADSLNREAQLYGRTKVDDASKSSMLHRLAETVLTSGSNTTSAVVQPVAAN